MRPSRRPLRRRRPIFLALIEAPRFPEWLTIPAYEKIIAEGA